MIIHCMITKNNYKKLPNQHQSNQIQPISLTIGYKMNAIQCSQIVAFWLYFMYNMLTKMQLKSIMVVSNRVYSSLHKNHGWYASTESFCCNMRWLVFNLMNSFDYIKNAPMQTNCRNIHCSFNGNSFRQWFNCMRANF